MTRHYRLLLAFLLVAWLGMVLACGGGGKQANTTPKKEVDPNKAATPTTRPSKEDKAATPTTRPSKEDPDELIIQKATKSRNKAIVNLEQVRARNSENRSQYEKELETFKKAKTEYEEQLQAFKKAKTEYDSLRRLDFAKNLKSESGLAIWYRDIIREFPGTEACKEAQRRLAGGSPKLLVVPSVPVKPDQQPIGPKQPEYEPEPSIPEVPTLAELYERRAEEEYDVNGLVLLRKTVKGVQGQFTMEITGTVVNRRARTLNYAQITFKVYDASGAQIGSALANINGLEPGARWNFKAVAFTPGTKYKFSKLSGF